MFKQFIVDIDDYQDNPLYPHIHINTLFIKKAIQKKMKKKYGINKGKVNIYYVRPKKTEDK